MKNRIRFREMKPDRFEFLAMEYLQVARQDLQLNWTGKGGHDSGRDIWGVKENGETFCYQCKNWSRLTISAVKDTIEKLKVNGYIPDHFILVCGSDVQERLKSRMIKYVKHELNSSVEIWDASEFELRLKKEIPHLIEEDKSYNAKAKLVRAERHPNYQSFCLDTPDDYKFTSKAKFHLMLLVLPFGVLWFRMIQIDRAFIQVNDWLAYFAAASFLILIYLLWNLRLNNQLTEPVEYHVSLAIVNRIESLIAYRVVQSEKGNYSIPIQKFTIQLEYKSGKRETFPLKESLMEKVKEGDLVMVYISEYQKLEDLKYFGLDEGFNQNFF